jgi:hypothetical protein
VPPLLPCAGAAASLGAGSRDGAIARKRTGSADRKGRAPAHPASCRYVDVPEVNVSNRKARSTSLWIVRRRDGSGWHLFSGSLKDMGRYIAGLHRLTGRQHLAREVI